MLPLFLSVLLDISGVLTRLLSKLDPVNAMISRGGGIA